MAEDVEDTEEEGPKSSSPVKMIVMMGVGAVVLVFLSMGLTFFLIKSSGMLNPAGGHAAPGAEAGKQKPATYIPLEPAFVVNIKDANGRMRFLQVRMDVMTREEKGADIVKQHISAIRNAVVLLLSTQTVEGLSANEGKERLRAATLEEVQKILEAETGKKIVEGAFFNSIVMQ
ncbi:MAG: flagellar basal body-associated FliL family protein [Gammaproteobacteria bacterium]|nr:flagellar basal body-associated FliL family protein [Gammaproteobacteria bacterium]